MDTSTSIPQLQFDPDKHPHSALKCFTEFVDQYEYRYKAQYSEPTSSAIEAANSGWKTEHQDTDPTGVEKQVIRKEWISRDKVRKLLGFFASVRLQQDWRAAEIEAAARDISTWENFITKMKAYYKPTENRIIRNFEFRQIIQRNNETFNAFSNRVEEAGRQCYFCNCERDCTAAEIAIRDQIVIGTSNERIREKAMLKDWCLADLRKKGMKHESAAAGEEKITHQVSKVGSYSYRNIDKRKSNRDDGKKDIDKRKSNRDDGKKCYRCSEPFDKDHMKHCKALNATCSNCKLKGHYAKACRKKDVRSNDVEKSKIKEQSDDDDDEVEMVYKLNIWQIKVSQSVPKFSAATHDFKSRLCVNNRLVNLLVDTGAKVSVCGMKQARLWGLLDRIKPSTSRIHPYNSSPIQVRGTATCAVSFKDRSVPVEFYILPGSCEPILAGSKALQLKIITFDGKDDIFNPVHMMDNDTKEDKGEWSNDILHILQQYPENFKGLGKMKDHQVKLFTDNSIKPIAVPPRTVPYHLQARVNDAISEMIKEGVIEEHPTHEPAPWVSCAVIVPKKDGELRVTLDARNINKAIQSTNQPIPRQEDIKAQLGGSRYFSKLDFKSAFWQLELEPESRKLTVFHCNGKLYRYTRLLMGVKPAQGELNAALKPIFAHIPQVHLIHDDLVIAAATKDEHNEALKAVMEAIKEANLTLKPSKCSFGKTQINFWGMVISSEGVRPDSEKMKALENLPHPKNREELKSFICMMQSNSDFIPNFSQLIAPLRDLVNSKVRFRWTKIHEQTFNEVLEAFREDALLCYFDMSKNTYIYTDAHKTGLGVILAQGDSRETARPVAFASRCTNKAERNYSQIDLEAMAVDYGLRRFRQYLIGAPKDAIIITDHNPLVSIFNGKRTGSIRTERIKMRHQDIRYKLMYQKGEDNCADFLSRHAIAWKNISEQEREEAGDLVNMLYTLHISPVLDAIGIRKIAEETAKDPILSKVSELVNNGKLYIPKDQVDLAPFKRIIHEITTLANGTLMKQDKIILPTSLHDNAIRLAHSGAHPGQNGIARRLRSHFYIMNLDVKIQKVTENCLDCQAFTTKTTREPIKPNAVPEKCWEEVSVDLFGPMPDHKHIVVVQDLKSRYPVAKIVPSTSAKAVLPVMGETYDAYGNPDRQKSDNGPPFNSKHMLDFTKERGIEQIKIPPGHPEANNVETVMKPLGKAMKVGYQNNKNPKETLQSFLVNYRDTPHVSTGVAPGAMLFRDGYSSNFPRREIPDDMIETARNKDIHMKEERKNKYNSNIHTKRSNFRIGDQVLVRNYKKSLKFDPTYLLERFTIMDISTDGSTILVRNTQNGQCLKRHPNDLKIFKGKFAEVQQKNDIPETEILASWRRAFHDIDNGDDNRNNVDEVVHNNGNTDGNDNDSTNTEDRVDAPTPTVRRSNRNRILNPTIYNDDFET